VCIYFGLNDVRHLRKLKYITVPDTMENDNADSRAMD
jgi:hypothetical protein